MTIKLSLYFKLVVIFSFIFCFSVKSQNQKLPVTEKDVEIEIFSLTRAPDSTGYYEVTFNSRQTKSQKLTMLIGKQEAQSLAISIKQIKPEYPQPLDLFEQAIIKSGYIVTKVVIDNVIKGIYTAKINCSNGEKNFELTARPADAATIALKFNCPILMNIELFEQH